MEFTISYGMLSFIIIIVIIVIIVLLNKQNDFKTKSNIFSLKINELENNFKTEKIQNENLVNSNLLNFENSLKQSSLEFESKLKEKDLINLKKIAEQKVLYQNWAIEQFEKFKEIELLKLKKELQEQSYKAASVLLQKWKIENESKIREDAIKRSYSVNLGKITEHLIPFHEVFLSQFNPKDARFIGSPIDLIVFDGYADKDEDIIIYFVEIKSGNSKLTETQKRIKKSVQKGEVRWAEINPDNQNFIEITTNKLEYSDNQLNLFNSSIEKEIEKSISELNISKSIYSTTIEKIKELLKIGYSKENAIEKIIGGVKFKNEKHIFLLRETILKSIQ